MLHVWATYNIRQSLCTSALEPHHVIRLYVFARMIKNMGVTRVVTPIFILLQIVLFHLLEVGILDVVILWSFLLTACLLVVERTLLLVSTWLRTSLGTLVHLL